MELILPECTGIHRIEALLLVPVFSLRFYLVLLFRCQS
jgi:hypothetical protein